MLPLLLAPHRAAHQVELRPVLCSTGTGGHQ
jgi:hypothetical protein